MNRRTSYSAIGAINATITLLRLKKCIASLAVIEPLACVSGHGFRFNVAAFWAGDHRL